MNVCTLFSNRCWLNFGEPAPLIDGSSHEGARKRVHERKEPKIETV